MFFGHLLVSLKFMDLYKKLHNGIFVSRLFEFWIFLNIFLLIAPDSAIAARRLFTRWEWQFTTRRVASIRLPLTGALSHQSSALSMIFLIQNYYKVTPK